MKLNWGRIYQRANAAKHMFLISNLGITTCCRHKPSCSRYFFEHTKQEGIKGMLKGMFRILSCW